MTDEEERTLVRLLNKKERERRQQEKEEDIRLQRESDSLLEAARKRHAEVNAEIARMGLDFLLEARLNADSWVGGVLHPYVTLDMLCVHGSRHHETADRITDERMAKLRQWVDAQKAAAV